MSQESSPRTNYYTHDTGDGRRAHAWRYLGKSVQDYQCMECELRVTKLKLKAATDA